MTLPPLRPAAVTGEMHARRVHGVGTSRHTCPMSVVRRPRPPVAASPALGRTRTGPGRRRFS